MSGAHTEECQACHGNGTIPYHPRLRCGTCHGAGEIEVWDEEEPISTTEEQS